MSKNGRKMEGNEMKEGGKKDWNSIMKVKEENEKGEKEG